MFIRLHDIRFVFTLILVGVHVLVVIYFYLRVPVSNTISLSNIYPRCFVEFVLHTFTLVVLWSLYYSINSFVQCYIHVYRSLFLSFLYCHYVHLIILLYLHNLIAH
jgi:hypothetical protein